MMLPRKCLGAVIVTLFPHLTFADYFTNPPNFVESSDGTQIATFDLSTTYIFGGKVQITWLVPSLPNINLSMVHWGSSNDTIITTFLKNQKNLGYYTWTIGIGDGIDPKMISADPRFALQLEDPTGKLTSTGKPIGFINSRLTSRGFIIEDPSSSSSTLAITPATLSSSQETRVPSPLRTTSPTSTTPLLHPNPTSSRPPAVIGLAVGFSVVSILALIALVLLKFQRRRTKKPQAKKADLVAQTELPAAGGNSIKPELQASLNVSPSIVELNAFQSFPLGMELGDSRLSRQEPSTARTL